MYVKHMHTSARTYTEIDTLALLIHHPRIQKEVLAAFFSFFFFVVNAFHLSGRTGLPREAIGPDGSNCLSRGVRTRVLKGNL